MLLRRVMVLAVACTVVFGAAVDAGAVTPTSRNGGGWVATPQTLGSAAVTVQVPTLRCVKGKAAGTVRLGLFVARRAASHVQPWSLDVRASCSAGVSRYRAEVIDGFASDSMPVSPGDRVRLLINGVADYEIDDLTSHAGMGGGGASGGAQQPVLTPRALFGGRLDGAVQRPLSVRFTGAHVNGARLSKTTHARHTQRSGSTARVGASTLGSNGTAFRLTVR